MPGERFPDKRARAVLVAGLNRLAKEQGDGGTVEVDGIAELGLRVRELLFTDDEVREEMAETKANRTGYSADCMQFATLEPSAGGIRLALWVGTDKVAEAKQVLRASEHPNAFRRLYGWVEIIMPPGSETDALVEWVRHARRHAAETKAGQKVSM